MGLLWGLVLPLLVDILRPVGVLLISNLRLFLPLLAVIVWLVLRIFLRLWLLVFRDRNK